MREVDAGVYHGNNRAPAIRIAPEAAARRAPVSGSTIRAALRLLSRSGSTGSDALTRVTPGIWDTASIAVTGTVAVWIPDAVRVRASAPSARRSARMSRVASMKTETPAVAVTGPDPRVRTDMAGRGTGTTVTRFGVPP